MNKHNTYIGQLVSSAQGAIVSNDSVVADDINTFSKMNVHLDVDTLAGGGSVQFTVQENFAGVWIDTAKSRNITATGQYTLAQHTLPNTSLLTRIEGAFPTLGSGSQKRVVSSFTGTVSSVSSKVYFGFFK